MKSILSLEEINRFKADGAIVLRNKFDIHWIEKLKRGIVLCLICEHFTAHLVHRYQEKR